MGFSAPHRVCSSECVGACMAFVRADSFNREENVLLYHTLQGTTTMVQRRWTLPSSVRDFRHSRRRSHSALPPANNYIFRKEASANRPAIQLAWSSIQLQLPDVAAAVSVTCKCGNWTLTSIVPYCLLALMHSAL